MMRTDCDTIRDLLPDYVSEQVPATNRSAIDSHLAVCADCRADVEIIEAVRRAAVQAPAGLQERVIGAVHARRTAPRYRPYRFAMLAAASIVALLGARAVIARMGGGRLSPAPASVAAPAVAVTFNAQPSAGTRQAQGGTEGRSLLEPFPGSSLAAVTDATTLNDLSEEQLKSLIAELES